MFSFSYHSSNQFVYIRWLENWLWIYFVSLYLLQKGPELPFEKWHFRPMFVNCYDLLCFLVTLIVWISEIWNTRKFFSHENGFALSSTRLARDSSVSWQNPKKLKSLSLHFTSFRDDSGKAWITFKQKGKKGERGYLKQFPSSEDANLPTITATNALFNIEKIRQDSLVISIKDHGLKFKIVAPFQTFNSIHTKSVSDS